MNKIEIYTDLIRCGFKLNTHTNKWTKDINSNLNIPSTQAMYFDYNSEYQYSQVKKLR
jgi:hypothetical protein